MTPMLTVKTRATTRWYCFIVRQRSKSNSTSTKAMKTYAVINSGLTGTIKWLRTAATMKKAMRLRSNLIKV